ncbi:unnamed protein product [Meloidogyne enterolobii]|uniref:Uncharacterized protein n=1 Tax=Meloidogyne enterolobii TaxID=390850 RepID=A0ACB0YG75_MELEN
MKEFLFKKFCGMNPRLNPLFYRPSRNAKLIPGQKTLPSHHALLFSFLFCHFPL